MCDCWGKHQSCSHRSGDGGVRPHIWVRWRMWVQSSTAYASMSALLDSLSALSMWLQQQFVQLHLSELCVCGRTCVCVSMCVPMCVHVLQYMLAFFGTRKRNPPQLRGRYVELYFLFCSLVLSKARRGTRSERGFLKNIVWSSECSCRHYISCSISCKFFKAPIITPNNHRLFDN